MMKYLCVPVLARRDFLALAASSAAMFFFSPMASARERTQKEYMQLAIVDISSKVHAQLEERARLQKQGGGAPLFVRIPAVHPFVDWDYYYIDAELQWTPNSGSSLPPVAVPRGFVSDLASVPSVFWGGYPPTGRYAYAAIVHDYLYWMQSTTRDVADDILAEAMRDAGTNEVTIAGFREVLRLVGGFAWDNNRKMRESGSRRILRRFPTNRLTSWADWKRENGVFAD